MPLQTEQSCLIRVYSVCSSWKYDLSDPTLVNLTRKSYLHLGASLAPSGAKTESCVSSIHPFGLLKHKPKCNILAFISSPEPLAQGKLL